MSRTSRAGAGGVWLTPAALSARRELCAGSLAPLADSLARELEPLLTVELDLPTLKARLSRAGGRCPRDGAMLAFDPLSPRRHRCPECGALHCDEAHHRWWIMGYHLWLAERAVHAATLYALRGDRRHAELARGVLERYAGVYLDYPNSDNVLGPSRPFFSTYLESLWLLHLCVALDLLETVAPGQLWTDRVRERLVAPSSELIAGYDEGGSNRQVWNNAALLAAALCLGRPERAGPLVWGRSGVREHLSTGLLSDGTWFEGENYHQFAHRGLWYCLCLAGATGEDRLPVALVERFDVGFRAPFESALPDFTAPSRRDSRYAVPLRQWRFAEMAELGVARRPEDPTLLAALRRLYDGDAPRGDSGRSRSTGEAERNEPPVALDRSSLGWKSALFAMPRLPALHDAAPQSVLQRGQGLAILRRRAGDSYVSLDYGESGGGHGHPDRLNVTYVEDGRRWLDDPGTGSYVDTSLHWYRSTLAHCAPIVDGRSQLRASGRLVAWDERGLAGLVEAVVEGTSPGILLRRTLVVLDDYFVDELRWEGDRDARVELPLQLDARLEGVGGWMAGAVDVEGAEHLRDVAIADVSPYGRRSGKGDGSPGLGNDAMTQVWRLARGAAGEGPVVAWLSASEPVTWWRAIAPGPPGRPAGRLHVARVRGARGWMRVVWSARSRVRDVACEGELLRLVLADGSRHVHSGRDPGWHIGMEAGGGRSTLDLGALPCQAAAAQADRRGQPAGGGHEVEMRAGSPRPARNAATSTAAAPVAAVPILLDVPVQVELAGAHYRRSELGWEEAGCPTARVTLSVARGELEVEVTVAIAQPCFAPPDAINGMDNERAEINFDSVQLHLILPAASGREGASAEAGWLVAPLTDGSVRCIALDAAAAALPLVVDWQLEHRGYRVSMCIPVRSLGEVRGGALRLGLDVLVNETVAGRERRRGQLVLSGTAGEFVYLRGDRHDASRCIPFLLPDVR